MLFADVSAKLFDQSLLVLRQCLRFVIRVYGQPRIYDTSFAVSADEVFKETGGIVVRFMRLVIATVGSLALMDRAR